MALNTQMAVATLQAEAAAFSTLCSNGTLEFYNGSQPPSAEVAVTTQQVLATLTFQAVAFGSTQTVTNGVMLTGAAFVGSGTGTVAAGTGTQPNWYRLKTSTGATISDGSAGLTNSNAIIGTIAQGAPVTASTFNHTLYISVNGL